MKIKIRKDIPGYKVGDISEINEETGMTTGNGYFMYKAERLIDHGFADEIKYDIDMKDLRSKAGSSELFMDAGEEVGSVFILRGEELNFLKSYRTVKALIDMLNGDWKPDWKNDKKNKCEIYFHHRLNEIDCFNSIYAQGNILPACKDKETVEKVISLCEPELKVLFGVN